MRGISGPFALGQRARRPVEIALNRQAEPATELDQLGQIDVAVLEPVLEESGGAVGSISPLYL